MFIWNNNFHTFIYCNVYTHTNSYHLYIYVTDLMEGYGKTHLRFNVAIENSRGAITICTATEKYRAHNDFFF